MPTRDCAAAWARSLARTVRSPLPLRPTERDLTHSPPVPTASLRTLDVLGAALANIANAANARVLDEAACRELLAEVGWCTLAMVDISGAATTRPYCVPLGYGYLAGTLYFATGAGRKLRALERHPAVCLTITDIETFHRWRSVVVSGHAIPVTSGAGRASVIQAFVQQRRPGNRLLTAGDASRLLSARMFRVEIDDMQGRAAELGPSMTENEHAARAVDALQLLLRSAGGEPFPRECTPGGQPLDARRERLLAGLELLTPRQRRLLGDGLEALLDASGIVPDRQDVHSRDASQV